MGMSLTMLEPATTQRLIDDGPSKRRRRGRHVERHDSEGPLIPEIHTSSTPPEKPMPGAQPSTDRGKPVNPPKGGSGISMSVEKAKVIVETCSCGASISVPIEAYGVRELMADWRTTHHHSTAVTPAEPADRALDKNTGVNIAPATGSFLATSRPRSFGFSAE